MTTMEKRRSGGPHATDEFLVRYTEQMLLAANQFAATRSEPDPLWRRRFAVCAGRWVVLAIQTAEIGEVVAPRKSKPLWRRRQAEAAVYGFLMAASLGVL